MAIGFSEFLNNIILTSNEHIKSVESKSFVMDINAPWGSGKTTFIEKFIRDNKGNKQYIVLKYNAWEADYWDNAFEPLISALLNDENIKPIIKEDNFKNKFYGTLKNISIALGKKIIIDKIGEEALNQAKEGVEVLKSGKIVSPLSDVCSNYDDFKKNLVNFKVFLEDIRKRLNVDKIVLIIDELDRCRPDFAIKTLEFIKHIFDVENYVFILSVDKKQLSESIKTIYGQGMDTVGYLNRFIDYSVNLPILDYETNLEAKLEKYSFGEQIENLIKILFLNRRKTYREIEYFFVALDLYKDKIKNSKSVLYSQNIIALLYLKTMNPDIFNDLRDMAVKDLNKDLGQYFCFNEQPYISIFNSIKNGLMRKESVEESIINETRLTNVPCHIEKIDSSTVYLRKDYVELVMLNRIGIEKNLHFFELNDIDENVFEKKAVVLLFEILDCVDFLSK